MAIGQCSFLQVFMWPGLRYGCVVVSITNNSSKLDQVYCAWLKKGLLCLFILYWVSKGLVCLYILEKVEIWSGDTDASLTHRQQNIGLLSFSTVLSLSWVTQFKVYHKVKCLSCRVHLKTTSSQLTYSWRRGGGDWKSYFAKLNLPESSEY